MHADSKDYSRTFAHPDLRRITHEAIGSIRGAGIEGEDQSQSSEEGSKAETTGYGITLSEKDRQPVTVMRQGIQVGRSTMKMGTMCYNCGCAVEIPKEKMVGLPLENSTYSTIKEDD